MLRAVGMGEGFVSFGGHDTWFRAGGRDGGATPLVLVHGGPGGTSDLFEPLDELARPVIRYDQRGSGRSDRNVPSSEWTLERYVEELRALREHLGLDELHLLGHSWGAMIALELALAEPRGLRSLTLCSPVISAPLWASETRRLRDALPPRIVAALERCEAAPRRPSPPRPPRPRLTSEAIEKEARTLRRAFPIVAHPAAARIASWASRIPALRGPAYEILGIQFVRRHVCRTDAMPMPVARMLAGMNGKIYAHMWGRSEFHLEGTLRDWDIRPRLPTLRVPTLILSGRHDEATPAMMEELQRLVPGARWTVLEESAHCAMLEEPEAFRRALEGFLAEHDAPTPEA